MSCEHAQCTGKHSGKWRIAELCPLAQEKRRASWRAYDGHLHEAYLRTYEARFGKPGETWPKVKNPDVKLDMRSQERASYKQRWRTTTVKGMLCDLRSHLCRPAGRLNTLTNELTPDARLVLEKYLSRELGGAV